MDSSAEWYAMEKHRFSSYYAEALTHDATSIVDVVVYA